jgi:hypothetical protein
MVWTWPGFKSSRAGLLDPREKGFMILQKSLSAYQYRRSNKSRDLKFIKLCWLKSVSWSVTIISRSRPCSLLSPLPGSQIQFYSSNQSGPLSTAAAVKSLTHQALTAWCLSGEYREKIRDFTLAHFRQACFPFCFVETNTAVTADTRTSCVISVFFIVKNCRTKKGFIAF